jgi:hypothetical protein
MKKQTKIVLGIVIVIAVMIIAISLNFPPVFKGITSGTFSKADKYHKSQMTEKDVQLRSELTSDTAKVKKMLKGLIYFSLFTEDLSNKIDSCVTIFQQNGMSDKHQGFKNVKVLKDYSEFIKNNNQSLLTTISMLSAFYFKTQSDQSVDVEKTLRDFGNYVKGMTQKDSIVDRALRSMDNFMLTEKILKERKTELSNLKSIRDQLLIKGIQLAGLLGDMPLSVALISNAISAQQELNIVLGQTHLGIYEQDKLNSLNTDNLGVTAQISVGSSQQLNQTLNAGNLGYLVYDKLNLNFSWGNAEDLKNIMPAAQISALLGGSDQVMAFASVAVLSSQGLNVVLQNINLNSVVQSQQLNAVFGTAQLNSLYGSGGNGGSGGIGSNGGIPGNGGNGGMNSIFIDAVQINSTNGLNFVF